MNKDKLTHEMTGCSVPTELPPPDNNQADGGPVNPPLFSTAPRLDCTPIATENASSLPVETGTTSTNRWWPGFHNNH